VNSKGEPVNDKKLFKASDTMVINKESTDALVRALFEYPEDNFVVMTHHTPSMLSSHPRWGGTTNLLNWAYANTYTEAIILEHPNIKCWVHGHTHESHNYTIDKCRVICNPRGYYPHELNPSFNNNLIFEVEE
jgi:hypothetical protein